MPAINYLAESDRIKAVRVLGSIVRDMTEYQSKLALLYILNGMDIYEAVDSANAVSKELKT